MIKFTLGMFVCYLLVSVFGMDIFANLWDEMINIFERLK